MHSLQPTRRQILAGGATLALGRILSPALATATAPTTRPSAPMHWADNAAGRPFSKDPAVVRFAGRYLMYYSLPPGGGQAGWSIGIAESANLYDWKAVGRLAPDGDVEKKGLAAPGARVLDGKVHLFYQTYGNGPRDAICHAVSEDGLRFTRNRTNPIFHPSGDWTCGRAIDADVIEHDGRLLLYCATRDPQMKTQMLAVAGADRRSDFSRDSWKQLCDAPILKPELPWEQSCIEAPALCRHDNRLFMFYAGAYNNAPQQIGCAVSEDGIKWKRLSDRPFLPNGKPGEWNSSESGHPFAFTDDDGQVYLFYQGNNDAGRTWYLSFERIQWKDNAPWMNSLP